MSESFELSTTSINWASWSHKLVGYAQLQTTKVHYVVALRYQIQVNRFVAYWFSFYLSQTMSWYVIF